jgi:hypothetical protein
VSGKSFASRELAAEAPVLPKCDYLLGSSKGAVPARAAAASRLDSAASRENL